jgi:fucose permease
MLIQFTCFGTCFVMSIPYPAAVVPSYLLFLLALFVLASGITLLQPPANPYISLLVRAARLASHRARAGRGRRMRATT